MEEIKVGDYVRTKRGEICKVLGVRQEQRVGKRVYSHLAYYLDNHKGSLTPAFILKHSPNIIDLIEVGDFITFGKNCYPLRVDTIWEFAGELNIELDNGAQFEDIKNDKDFQIYSIVTKEQFKSVEYKLEE